MSMREFPTHTEDDAPTAARPLLAGTRKQMGFVPIAMARQAESPAVLQSFFHLLGVLEKSSLAPLEQEVLAMEMGRVNGCELCLTIHRARLKQLEASPALIEALNQGSPIQTERLEALVGLIRSLLARTGDVDESSWKRFLAAGFTRAQALELVVGIGAYTISTFANRLVEAPVDPQLTAG